MIQYKKLYLIILFIVSISISSCSTTTELLSDKINKKSISVTNDIFTIIDGDKKPLAGYGDLLIKVNLKTHLKGMYLVELLNISDTHHGGSVYQFLLNIDGQALILEANGKEEDTTPEPYYFWNCDYKRPGQEAGEGIRYYTEKKIRLKAGKHNVFFTLPQDEYAMEFNLYIVGGSTNILELKPVYRYRKMLRRESFLSHFRKFKVYLNSKLISNM